MQHQNQKGSESEPTIGQETADIGPEPDESGFNDTSRDGEVEPGGIDGPDAGDPPDSSKTASDSGKERTEDPRF